MSTLIKTQLPDRTKIYPRVWGCYTFDRVFLPTDDPRLQPWIIKNSSGTMYTIRLRQDNTIVDLMRISIGCAWQYGDSPLDLTIVSARILTLGDNEMEVDWLKKKRCQPKY